MPNEVRYTPIAVRDIEGIYDYIYQESRSEKTADGMIVRIESTARTFATQPNAGAPCPELFRRGRYFVVGSYVAFYRPVSDGIEIVRVLHGAQDLKKYFRRRRT